MNSFNKIIKRLHFVFLVMHYVHFRFSTRENCHLPTCFFLHKLMYLIKAKLNELLNTLLIERAHFILHEMQKVHLHFSTIENYRLLTCLFSTPDYHNKLSNESICELVKKSVMHLMIFWTIYFGRYCKYNFFARVFCFANSNKRRSSLV